MGGETTHYSRGLYRAMGLCDSLDCLHALGSTDPSIDLTQAILNLIPVISSNALAQQILSAFLQGFSRWTLGGSLGTV